MRTVTPGATRSEVTPLAYSPWPSGPECGPAGKRAAKQATGHARSPGINFSGTARARRSGQVTQTRPARC
jgi:hypothetical protein